MKENSRVLLIAAEELRSRGTGYDSKTELAFEGKQFKRVLSLRKLFHKVAIDYCERESKTGRLCLLVEEEDQFTVWQTEQLLKPISDRSNAPSFEGTAISAPPKALPAWDRTSRSKDTASLSQNSPSVKHSTTIEPWFVERCQQALTYHVGAIASVYVQETLDKFPQITYHRLISELAAKISDPQQADEFWQQVLTLITAPSKQKKLQSQRDQSVSTQFLPKRSLQKQLPAQNTTDSSNTSHRLTYRGITYTEKLTTEQEG